MRRLIALALAGLVLVVLIVAQLVLPGIAEQRLRDTLSKSVQVRSVNATNVPGGFSIEAQAKLR